VPQACTVSTRVLYGHHMTPPSEASLVTKSAYCPSAGTAFPAVQSPLQTSAENGQGSEGMQPKLASSSGPERGVSKSVRLLRTIEEVQ
jgi:hypothetical protein